METFTAVIPTFMPSVRLRYWFSSTDQTKFLLPFDQVVEDDSQIVEHAEKLSGVLLGHSLHNTLSNHKNIQQKC